MMQNFFLSATALLEKGEFAKALDVFFFLVTIDNSSLPFWLGLGISHDALGNFPEAVNSFLRAACLNPKCVEAYEGVIRGLVQQNLHNEALNVCDDGLAFAEANRGQAWAQLMQEHLMELKRSIMIHKKF